MSDSGRSLISPIVRCGVDTAILVSETLRVGGLLHYRRPLIGRRQNLLGALRLTRVLALHFCWLSSDAPPAPDRVAFLAGINVASILV
jgi:hypothetical protein